MKMFKEYRQQVLTAYVHFRATGESDSLKQLIPLYIRSYVHAYTRDEDMASEVFLKVWVKTDHLWNHFVASEKENILAFLNTCGRNQIKNQFKLRTKTIHLPTLYQEWGERSVTHPREPWEKDTPPILRSLRQLRFRYQVAFGLRFDIESDAFWENDVRKYCLSHGLDFGELKKKHAQKRENFLDRRQKLVHRMEILTYQITHAAHTPEKIAIYRDRKEKTHQRLQTILWQGLYSFSELERILGINRESLRRNYLSFVQTGEKAWNFSDSGRTFSAAA